MSEVDVPAASPLLLVTVEGEAKTAKTTGGFAITQALHGVGYKVYEADAGAFFRRLTICALEFLGYQDLDSDTREITSEELCARLVEVVENSAAFADREWPSLQSLLVERYVSVIGNSTKAQDAMDDWYGKVLSIAQNGEYDVLVINARNPRDRLRGLLSPTLDLVVYCEPGEAARRILFARGITEPTGEQLSAQTADVERRRHLDRNRDKYPYVDPKHIVEYTDMTPESAGLFIRQSWSAEYTNSAAGELPATIRLDTTHIDLAQTKAIIAALALAAVKHARS
jgi:hypothetical protein